jgi:hypothetical protein
MHQQHFDVTVAVVVVATAAAALAPAEASICATTPSHNKLTNSTNANGVYG